MKFALVFVILLFQFSVNSQIKYAPVFIDQCSGEIIHPHYEVTDENGNQYFPTDFLSDEITFPKLGDYIITLSWESPIHVTIASENQQDTFYTANLLVPVCICSPPPTKYEFCSEIAEGYCVDYYAPGVKRSEGTFKNGDPIDTVKTYYLSGELMEIDITTRTGKKSVEFYKNGNKKSEFDQSKGYTHRTYFPDGQLKVESTYKNYTFRETEYFQSEQLKRKERERKAISYAESGEKIQVTHRKARFRYARMSSREYHLKRITYNQEGEVTWQLTFSRSDNNSPDFPQNLNEIDLNNIEELVIYKNGKPHQKLVQTYHYVASERIVEVVNYNRDKCKWVEVSKHGTEVLKGVIKRLK